MKDKFITNVKIAVVMKKLIVIIIFVSVSLNGFAQQNEFGDLTNGLIYPDSTVKQLKHIVDSLNLKFKVCDFNKAYKAKLQTKAHYIYLSKGNINSAKKDLEANISFDEFTARYKQSDIVKDLLVVKFEYTDYEEKKQVEYSTVPLNKKYDYDISFEKDSKKYTLPLKNSWVFKYKGKTDYSDESISAFYFTEDFTSQQLPEKYSRMVQYSECMVDTSTQIFYEDAKRGGRNYSIKKSKKITEFMDYVSELTNKPEYDDKNYDNYSVKYHIWDSTKYKTLDSIKSVNKKFDELLKQAVTEALEKGGSSDEFEEYVGRFYSKKSELQLKRGRIVVGGCSMDNSPRVHALNIAKLSAATVNWEVFLRSHLDIMNDYFERASDGSYAWKERKTYIKELEVLDINVLDLLLGISLRVDNPSNNHYYGSVGRLGRALSESENSAEIESKMLEMIADSTLDDYNRLIIFYLYLNYNYNLEDEIKRAESKAKLKNSIKSLPDYISSRLTLEED